MNYLKTLKNIVIGDKSAEKIGDILEISEKEFSCKSSECQNKYKESCFDLRGDAANAPLYETARPANLHFLVATGKTDWEHDAFEESGTILKLISGKASKISNKYSIIAACNVTNEPLDFMDPECLSLNKLNVLVQPWFVRICGITKDNIDTVFEGIENVFEKSKEDESIKGKEGEELIEVLSNVEGLEVFKDINQSIILLCSHKTRDKKCGITAPIMKKEFESQLKDLDLFRDASDNRDGGVSVLFVNHVGGHKFAANVLIYNKHGEFVWFARCTPLNVNFIINETVLNHKVYPNNIRACSKFDAIKW